MFQKLLSMKKPNKLEQLNLNESPSSHLTSDRDIVKKKDGAILAFRTITTMLSLIQSPTEVTKSGITGQKDISDSHRRDLRVLDAISALAIRKHEIAAVMAKRHNGANIQVLVSANNSEPALTIPQQYPDSKNDSDLSFLRWFMITPNPRYPKKNSKNETDSLTARYTYPTLVDPNTQISEELSMATQENLLQTFLRTQWGKESFDTHMWMLKTLIGRSAQDRRTLSLYVIAASFPKMLRRMNGSPISKRYFGCLQRLKSMDFGFIAHEQPDIAMTKDSSSDRSFLEIIRGLQPGVVSTNISNLRRMSEETKDVACEIYNENTYMEFHGLLCELLDRFRISLRKVEEVQVEMSAHRCDSDKTMLVLKNAVILGTHLRAMVRSAAMEKHLKSIAHLLDVDGGKLSMETTDEGVEDEDDEGAEDLVLKPYSMFKDKLILPWQSYKDWLRLTTLYFDAMIILSTHMLILSPTDDIDIKILAPSLPDQRMLPWKELLRHNRYFPELPNDPEQPSSEDLISFLTFDFDTTEGTPNERAEGKKRKGRVGKREGISIEVVNSLQNLVNRQESSDNVTIDETIDLIIEQMKPMNNCAPPGWGEYNGAILRQLSLLKAPKLTPQGRLTLSRKTLEMLETLRGHSSLHQRLKEGTPLSRGDSFSGTRHCEVCIASICSLSEQPGSHDSRLGPILSECSELGQAIGVSKRCCAVCARLLKLLKTRDGEMFVVTEEHSTITPCTLPEWLPMNIIEEMVMEFGVRLRRELVKLHKGTEVLRRQTASTDTRRLSLDSMEMAETEVFDAEDVKNAFHSG